jgi:glycosyltransferase involved in cell wall biosynthesis
MFGAAFIIAPIWLAGLACAQRVDAGRRRGRGDLPRVVWGPTPLINIKYWSQSVQRYGFTSTTLVKGFYLAFKRSDFDRYVNDYAPRSVRLRFLAPYFAFAWCLANADVFVLSYDGGLLAQTPLRWLECQLIRLAGKRTVLIPFGGDIAVPGTLGPIEAGVYATYPDLLKRADEIRRRVLYFCKHADFVVRTYQPGFQPRTDLLWPNALGIDADSWKPVDGEDGADARTSEVVIVHPTNHRSIKGTDFLIKAVKELEDEGLHLRLEIMERQPNEEVKAAMGRADMVGEQFIAGYGLTGVEAMALGRPVLANLTWLGQEFSTDTFICECPIVSTTPETLKYDVRRLAIDPQLRGRLGRAGRDYVLKYHSAEAVGRIWESILRHVWLQEPVDSTVSAAFASRAETG